MMSVLTPLNTTAGGVFFTSLKKTKTRAQGGQELAWVYPAPSHWKNLGPGPDTQRLPASDFEFLEHDNGAA